MLLLDHPLQLGPVTVYGDHISRTTFHYLPGNPRLVGPDGIALLVYRGDIGGGLLTLDVDLSHPASALAATQALLEQRVGHAVDLVPVLFDAGTVRLTTLGVTSDSPDGPDATATTRLVEEVLATATPSLLGGCRAIFSVRLDREGAVAMQAAVRSGLLPVTVAYDLSYRGLRPASGIRAQLDYAMTYDYLRTRMAVGTLWFKADLDRESEALERSGHITLTDVDYSGSDPALLAARREAALATLHELVETLFFAPATSPASLTPTDLAGSSVGVTWAANGSPRAAFLLRSISQHEEQLAIYDRTELSVATVRAAPQGALATPSGVDPESLMREIDLVDTSDQPVTVTARAIETADWAGVDAIQVDLRSSDQTRSVVLNAADPEASVIVPAGPTEFRLTSFTRAALGDLGIQRPRSEGYQSLDTNTVTIDPAAVAGRRSLVVALGAFAPELASAATVRVTAQSDISTATQDRPSASFVLRPDTPAATVGVWGDPVLAVVAELATVAGSVTTTQTLAPGQTLALVNLPRERFRTVLVTREDPLDRYQSIDVELESRPGTPRVGLSLTAAEPSAYWTRLLESPDSPPERSAPAAEAGYRVRVTTLGRNAVVSAGDWADAADSLLVLGDRDLCVDRVTVVPVGWSQVVGALLTFTSLDPPPGVPGTAELLLSDATPATVSLPRRRSAALGYQVSGQIFAADAVDLVPFEASAEVLLLSPTGPPALRQAQEAITEQARRTITEQAQGTVPPLVQR